MELQNVTDMKEGFVKKYWHVGLKSLGEHTILTNKANLKRLDSLWAICVYEVPQFDEFCVPKYHYLLILFNAKVLLHVKNDILQLWSDQA